MIDAKTIHAIGKSPYAAPVMADMTARRDRHAIGHERQDEGRAERRERRHPRRLAPHPQHEAQHQNRNRGDQRRQSETAADRLIVLLPHRRASYFAPTRSFDASAHSAITVKYRCTPSAPTMKGWFSPG